MNLSLLEKIAATDNGILATIIGTEGHSYKKTGDKALFVVGDPFPVHGNLGSLCVEQEIEIKGREAHAAGAPRVVDIDTSEATDIHFGYGAFCGGRIRVLLEPLTPASKKLYRTMRRRLERNETFYLVHDLQTGDLSVAASRPTAGEHMWIEEIPRRRNLFIFGATPLAHVLIACVEEMDFEIHVIDWRPDYLARFSSVRKIAADATPYPFDSEALVLIMSHSYEKDKEVLRAALEHQCAYIGLLSSRTRREKMYEDLVGEGFARKQVEATSSPIGIDINARSESEIAISIAAELVEFKNR